MESDVGHAPAEGKITPEAIKAAENMIGMQLRPEGPYLQDATEDTIRNFCNGIGDLNPLYRDLEHGRLTRHGSMLAHPNFPMAFGWVGRTRWGLPGVHGFYAGNDWEMLPPRPPRRPHHRDRARGRRRRQEERVLRHPRAAICRGDLLQPARRDSSPARSAPAPGTSARRRATPANMTTSRPTNTRPRNSSTSTRRILDEEKNIRGGNVRYWEEVQEGEELPEIVRGPLSLMDTMGFLVGCGRGHTHGVIFKNAVKHPGHFFRNPEAGGGIEYTGIGHHRESTAKEVGVPGVYDYGPQRSAWMASLVTNWMGDAGFLKRIKTRMSRFNTMGDCTWARGTVTRKYMKDGYALVDIEIKGENQRGELTTPGLATVCCRRSIRTPRCSSMARGWTSNCRWCAEVKA